MKNLTKILAVLLIILGIVCFALSFWLMQTWKPMQESFIKTTNTASAVLADASSAIHGAAITTGFATAAVNKSSNFLVRAGSELGGAASIMDVAIMNVCLLTSPAKKIDSSAKSITDVGYTLKDTAGAMGQTTSELYRLKEDTFILSEQMHLFGKMSVAAFQSTFRAIELILVILGALLLTGGIVILTKVK